MPGRECYHCKLWIEEGEAHDCWTTTEAALTADLSEDLRDAWERLRDAMVDLGEQRIYASGSCIMFSRDVCHVFVRPKRKVLEICIFLDRAVKDPRVRRAAKSSKVKFANLVHIQHRDEVERPLTDWLSEAYDLQDVLAARKVGAPLKSAAPSARADAQRKSAADRVKKAARKPAGAAPRTKSRAKAPKARSTRSRRRR
jgi:hypothetical protein